jgi:hypothetical protein
MDRAQIDTPAHSFRCPADRSAWSRLAGVSKNNKHQENSYYSLFIRLGSTLFLVPTARTCLVSFTDSEGIRQSVEVTASTLYEAAVLAIVQFRNCGFTENAPGPATRLTVAIKQPGRIHDVPWGKIEAWLQGDGRSPADQGTKIRLRELLRS